MWREASWLYETGRTDRAVAVLKQAPAQMVELAARQLALWSNPAASQQDLGALKSSYEQAEPLRDGLARTLYAAALLRAGQKERAKELIARWPLPESEDNLLGSLMYPEFLRLRQELR